MEWVRITIVPVLILLLSLAGRYWGPAVSGILAGLPLVGGPIILFLAFDHGPVFASGAAHGTLLGLVALACNCFAYISMSRRFGWPVSLLVSLGVFFVCVGWLQFIYFNPHVSMAIVVFFIVLLYHWSPHDTPGAGKFRLPGAELVCRMAAGAALVMAITSVARLLGPKLSGLLTAFPVVTSVLAVFTHRQHGRKQAAALLKGLILGLLSMATFNYMVAVFIQSSGIALSYVMASAGAVAVQVGCYGFFRWELRRSLKCRPGAHHGKRKNRIGIEK